MLYPDPFLCRFNLEIMFAGSVPGKKHKIFIVTCNNTGTKNWEQLKYLSKGKQIHIL